MVRFQSKIIHGITMFEAKVLDVVRFYVKENESYAGGWDLYSLDMLHLGHFDTMCKIETYIEEMDK